MVTALGNKGVIRSGDIQWMTAGSGIIHQEMPKEYLGLMQGFQLWVNLPAKKKMIAPKYRGITKHQIPSLKREGAEIKIIAGKIDGVEGPVQDLVVDVEYFDVTLAAGKTFEHSPKERRTAFVYVIEGSGYVEDMLIESQHCVLFGDGDTVEVKTREWGPLLVCAGETAWRARCLGRAYRHEYCRRVGEGFRRTGERQIHKRQ